MDLDIWGSGTKSRVFSGSERIAKSIYMRMDLLCQDMKIFQSEEPTS
jgi:hypothetical protein